MVTRVEQGDVNATIESAGRMLDALDVDVRLVCRLPFTTGSPLQRDGAHATCSAYIQRRLEAAGWLIAREVEIVHGRSHGWIDLLAFDPRSGTLVVIEVKTEIDDVGRIERTLAWYQREAWSVARRLGWRPSRVAAWLLLLATEQKRRSSPIQSRRAGRRLSRPSARSARGPARPRARLDRPHESPSAMAGALAGRRPSIAGAVPGLRGLHALKKIRIQGQSSSVTGGDQRWMKRQPPAADSTGSGHRAKC
jgi:hypothetical protein